MMVSHSTASMVAARSLSWDSEYPMAGSARCTQGFRLNVSIKLPCAAVLASTILPAPYLGAAMMPEP
jgi:hypothetical protein